MAKSSVYEYGKKIKKRLIDLDQTQIWLIDEVSNATGLYFDGYYLQKIMAGTRKPPKIIAAINAILEIDYPEDEPEADQEGA